MATKKTTTLSNTIAETLMDDINRGKLYAGETLIESKIAEQFHTSNIPVREALRILEGEHFIIHKKFSGYTVRNVSPEEMIELYDIIRYLSVQLLSRGIPRYTELTYHRFRTLIDEMDNSKDTDSKVRIFNELVITAFSPAGLKYSLDLTIKVLNRNATNMRVMIEESYKGIFPTSFFRHFLELCQQKETVKAIQVWMDEYDSRTKIYVANMSSQITS